MPAPRRSGSFLQKKQSHHSFVIALSWRRRRDLNSPLENQVALLGARRRNSPIFSPFHPPFFRHRRRSASMPAPRHSGLFLHKKTEPSFFRDSSALAEKEGLEQALSKIRSLCSALAAAILPFSRHFILPFSATGGGRLLCPRLGTRVHFYIKKQSHHSFVIALPWRRRRDLNPRAGYPTYALSRGASSPLEYFSMVTILKY